MAKGRKNIPIEIKRNKGTLNVTRDNFEPLKVEIVNDLPLPPANLGAKGIEQWNLTCKELKANGILAAVDLNHVLTYCAAVDMLHYALDEIQKTGYLGLNGNGIESKSPNVVILNDAISNMSKVAPLIGITPSGRTKIAANKQQDTGNKILQLMNKTN